MSAPRMRTHSNGRSTKRWMACQNSILIRHLVGFADTAVVFQVSVFHHDLGAGLKSSLDKSLPTAGRTRDDLLRPIAFGSLNQHPPFALVQDECARRNSHASARGSL